MVKEIERLWISTIDGKILFRFPKYSKMSELFAGLFSTIDRFAKEGLRDQLRSIALGGDRYDFLRRKEILFVSHSDNRFHKKHIKESLNIIANIFFNKYYPLKDDKKIREKQFIKEIQPYLDDTLESFWNCF